MIGVPMTFSTAYKIRSKDEEMESSKRVAYRKKNAQKSWDK